MGSGEAGVKVKPHKRNGVHMSFWISDGLVAKLDALAESSGMSRTKVWKALLEGKPIPDKSFARMCSEISKIGGLIKSQIPSGPWGDSHALGQELVELGRALKKGQEKG